MLQKTAARPAQAMTATRTVIGRALVSKKCGQNTFLGRSQSSQLFDLRTSKKYHLLLQRIASRLLLSRQHQTFFLRPYLLLICYCWLLSLLVLIETLFKCLFTLHISFQGQQSNKNYLGTSSNLDLQSSLLSLLLVPPSSLLLLVLFPMQISQQEFKH